MAVDFPSRCSGLPAHRRCTLLPQIDISSWTLLHRKFMVEFSLGPPLAFTYFVAVPVPDKENGESVDLSEQDTRPLLACLARNFVAAGCENPFIPEVHPGPVFPLCSSSTAAMGVGFFAYETEHLALLEMSVPQLLQKKAPIDHPLGSFWLLPAAVAWDKVRLTQTTTQDAVPMSKLIQEAPAAHLQSRMRKLEDHIEELELELGVNHQNLMKVSRQLAFLAEKQSS